MHTKKLIIQHFYAYKFFTTEKEVGAQQPALGMPNDHQHFDVNKSLGGKLELHELDTPLDVQQQSIVSSRISRFPFLSGGVNLVKCNHI